MQDRARRRHHPLYLVVAACACLSMPSSASAASLGGLHASSLKVERQSELPSVPHVRVADSFTTGTFVTGRVPEYRQYLTNTWRVLAGSWTILNGQVDPPNGNNRMVVYDAGTPDAIVSATLYKRGRFQIGVVARANPTGSVYLVAVVDEIDLGTVRLDMVVNGSATTLASVSGVGDATVVTIAVTLQGTVVDVLYNGTVVINRTLSSQEYATLGSSTGYGLWASTSNNDRFDDFFVATWPPSAGAP